MKRKLNIDSWDYAFKMQSAQMPIIKKLYAKNGLELKNTCGACPEQYEVFKDGNEVAYYRLRHGEFRVDYPECGGETIYEAEPNGDGIFDDNERLNYLAKAMHKVLSKLKEDGASFIYARALRCAPNKLESITRCQGDFAKPNVLRLYFAKLRSVKP